MRSVVRVAVMAVAAAVSLGLAGCDWSSNNEVTFDSKLDGTTPVPSVPVDMSIMDAPRVATGGGGAVAPAAAPASAPAGGEAAPAGGAAPAAGAPAGRTPAGGGVVAPPAE